MVENSVFNLTLLSATIFMPLVGAVLLLFVRGSDVAVAKNSRAVALLTSLATFVLSLFLLFGFDPHGAAFQFVEKRPWIESLHAYYYVGIDGMSLLFVLLSTFLTPLAILSSFEAIKERVREYMIAFLILESMMVGMFCSLDFVLFYLFFEGVLIPMYLIIGIWGGPRRIYASLKFFLYTFLGSVLMLIALIYIYHVVGETSILAAYDANFTKQAQIWLWIAFFASFAVKVPMWPVHTWLPDAHVEAPTAGSVILAGVLLKMGGYGFLRFSLPILPEASIYFAHFIFALSIIAVIYTSLVALAQKDMKKLIAYSSIAHMGIVTFGTFTFLEQGVQGAIFQMVSHGIVSAALFLCVGVVYDRIHTRDIDRYGGLVVRMPFYAFGFMLFIFASIGLPGTVGFVGEILVLISAFRLNGFLALGLATGMVLGAAYALWLYRRVIFGNLVKEDLKKILDVSLREKIIFAPLVAAAIFFGIYPSPILKISEQALPNILKNVDAHLKGEGRKGTQEAVSTANLQGILPESDKSPESHKSVESAQKESQSKLALATTSGASMAAGHRQLTRQVTGDGQYVPSKEKRGLDGGVTSRVAHSLSSDPFTLSSLSSMEDIADSLSISSHNSDSLSSRSNSSGSLALSSLISGTFKKLTSVDHRWFIERDLKNMKSFSVATSSARSWPGKRVLLGFFTNSNTQIVS